LRNDVTLLVANFVGVEILKRAFIELIFLSVRERTFRIHFNFLVTYLHWNLNWTLTQGKYLTVFRIYRFHFSFCLKLRNLKVFLSLLNDTKQYVSQCTQSAVQMAVSNTVLQDGKWI